MTDIPTTAEMADRLLGLSGDRLEAEAEELKNQLERAICGRFKNAPAAAAEAYAEVAVDHARQVAAARPVGHG